MTNKKDFDVNDYVSGNQQKSETVGKQSTNASFDAVNGTSESNDSAVPTESEAQILPNGGDRVSKHTLPTLPSDQLVPSTCGEETHPIASTADSDPIRRTVKQRKSDLDEYRRRYMPIPRIEDRKPVFVSRATRDRLDWIVRLLGERRMSVSGLIENIALHHLAVHEADIEHWRKM